MNAPFVAGQSCARLDYESTHWTDTDQQKGEGRRSQGHFGYSMSGMNLNDWQEFFAVLFFVGSVTIIFTWSAKLVLIRALSASKHQPGKPLSKQDKVVLSLGLFGIICVTYGFFVEPYWLSVTHVELTSSKIHKNQKVRIVHISDFHCDPKPRLEEQLPSIIAAEKPDVILFTGDAINSREGLPVFRKCLTELAEIAPTFVVKGNWDTCYFTEANLFGGTGATELDVQPVQLKIEDNVICVAGLPAPSSKTKRTEKRKSVQDVMQDVPENIYRVFLYHYPDFIEEMEKNKIDLYLAGHTHGGQVALPFYGALVTLSNRGKQFEAGLYQRGGTHLYVNRGIGMEGGIAPRVRFCARPEVTVIDVVGQQGN